MHDIFNKSILRGQECLCFSRRSAEQQMDLQFQLVYTFLRDPLFQFQLILQVLSFQNELIELIQRIQKPQLVSISSEEWIDWSYCMYWWEIPPTTWKVFKPLIMYTLKSALSNTYYKKQVRWLLMRKPYRPISLSRTFCIKILPTQWGQTSMIRISLLL